MMNELDEITLARAKRGDMAARAVLIKTHQRSVYALVSRMMVGQRSIVDDLAQDSFIKVLDALPRFDPHGPARLSSWILTIATRVCIDALRRSKRRAIDADAEASRVAPERPEEALERRELRGRVEAAMAELPGDQRAILVLRAYHDLDYPEIAAALEIEEGTVKSRLSRARAALKSVMEKRGVAP